MRSWLLGPLALLACTSTRSAQPENGGLAERGTSPKTTEREVAGATETVGGSESAPLDDTQIDWNQNPVMRALGRISETMTSTEYSPETRVDEDKGIYEFDCSGMVDWLLHKSAPMAHASCTKGLGHRPLASDFYGRIAAAPVQRMHRGWRQVARIDEVEPGDVIAWIKPVIVPSRNTGHVAVVVLKPVRSPEVDGAYLLRIADSTSLLHQDDTRVGRRGFGLGTILVLTDGVGTPTGYGWVGRHARTFETRIAVGRPLR